MTVRSRILDDCILNLNKGEKPCYGKTSVTPEEWNDAGTDDDKREKNLKADARAACAKGCDCFVKPNGAILKENDDGSRILFVMCGGDPTANVP